jgi:hypothetical protein
LPRPRGQSRRRLGPRVTGRRRGSQALAPAVSGNRCTRSTNGKSRPRGFPDATAGRVRALPAHL